MAPTRFDQTPTPLSTTPTPSTTSAAVRIELEAVRQTREFSEAGVDLVGRYEDAAAMIERFVAVVDEARRSNQYTSLGLIERARTLSEPLVRAAERLESESDKISRGLTADVEKAWQTFLTPASTAAEQMLFADRLRRLEQEDPIVVEYFLREAVRLGDDLLVRVALTAPAPPGGRFEGARWRPLLTDAFIEELRKLIAERVSPLGSQSWRAAIISGLAGYLRRAVDEQR